MHQQRRSYTDCNDYRWQKHHPMRQIIVAEIKSQHLFSENIILYHQTIYINLTSLYFSKIPNYKASCSSRFAYCINSFFPNYAYSNEQTKHTQITYQNNEQELLKYWIELMVWKFTPMHRKTLDHCKINQ